jgi:hypothetical protein
MEGSLTDSNTSHSTDIQTRAAQADFDATRGASAQYTDFSRLVSPVSSQSSFSQDTEPSWLHRHDPVSIRSGEGEFGCSHYRRRCKLVAPCCDKAYWCRHCHNDSEMEMQQVPFMIIAMTHILYERQGGSWNKFAGVFLMCESRRSCWHLHDMRVR